jgi:hypothetical protein
MRLIISAAIAAAAICGMSMNAVAANEPVHYAGGPIQEGKMCWVSTSNDNGYGYWKACAPAMKHHKK